MGFARAKTGVDVKPIAKLIGAVCGFCAVMFIGAVLAVHGCQNDGASTVVLSFWSVEAPPNVLGSMSRFEPARGTLELMYERC